MERYYRFYERQIAMGMIIAGEGMKKSLFGKMLSNLQITRTPFFIPSVFDDVAPGITVCYYKGSVIQGEVRAAAAQKIALGFEICL